MWTGRGSLPQGQARCLACRRTVRAEPPPLPEQTCPVCGRRFTPTSRKPQVYCNPTCRSRRSRFTSAPRRSAASRGYGNEHIKARKVAAQRHSPRDPCTRCGRPLGPMSSRLHLDHTPDRSGYLGFAHGSCNMRAGAREGAKRANRKRRRLPSGLVVTGWYARSCPICGSAFRTPDPHQATCGRTCGYIHRWGRGPVSKVRYGTCSHCAATFVRHGTTSRRCPACRHLPYGPYTRRGTPLSVACKRCGESVEIASTTRRPDYCAPCRELRKRETRREAKQRAKQRDPQAWRERKREENRRREARRRAA